MRKLLITMLICSICVMPVFADTDSKIENAKKELGEYVDEVKVRTVGHNFTEGAVFVTTENLSVEDVKEMFGGEWREVKSTFLWATDDSITGEPDEDVLSGKNLHMPNQRGGKDFYSLAAGMAVEDYGFSFWTDAASGFTGHNTVFGATHFTPERSEDEEEKASNAAIVVDETSEDIENTAIDLRPPFLKVKMFEKLGDEGSYVEPDPDSLGDDSGDGGDDGE